jgi:hypothetical protein
MKFRHLLEHLARINQLERQLEELRTLPAKSVDTMMYIAELQKTLDVYLNCDVEQPSK